MDELDLVKHLPDENSPPRPRARASARAALVECFEREGSAVAEPARRRPRWIPRLAFVGASATVVAALLVALGTGSPGGKPAFAEAAQLEYLARLAPHLQIAGGWQITDFSVARESGAIRFHYERFTAPGTDGAEIRWSAASIEQLGRQLERRGFKAAGTMPTATLDARKLRAGDFRHMESFGRARVYVLPRRRDGLFSVVGLWSQGRRSFELSARVPQLNLLERLLERLEILGREEWLVAIRPGGAKWLIDSFDGAAQVLESAPTELPNGAVVYETTIIGKEPGSPEGRDFTSPLPVIRRHGDKVTVTFERAPSAGINH